MRYAVKRDNEAIRFVVEAALLGHVRRRRARRCLLRVYGNRALKVAALYPARAGATADASEADVTQLLHRRVDLFIDPEPGSKRVRGVLDVKSPDFQKLRKAFRTLSRI
jgi:hypothetical protein